MPAGRLLIRSTERMTGLNRNTFLRLLEVVGERCARLMDNKMRNLRCRYVQCDEIWTFVQKKQRQVRGDANSYAIGDQWVFVAMDADTKLVASFHIGKRTMDSTKPLSQICMIVWRIDTTDYRWLHFYNKAVEESFGLDVDFAQLVKLYADYGQHGHSSGTPQAQSSRLYPRCAIGSPSTLTISTTST